MSNSRSQDRQNSGDNVFAGMSAGTDEASLFIDFLDSHDFSENTRRAVIQDVRKFARWFADANKEPFTVDRVTVRDVTDFRHHLRTDKGQAISTVNRSLVTLRRYFAWLVAQGNVPTNPAKSVKELRRSPA